MWYFAPHNHKATMKIDEFIIIVLSLWLDLLISLFVQDVTT